MTNYAEVPVEEAALTGMAVAVHAAIKPEATSVVDQQGEYNWDYLNKRSNQLANYMRGLGLGVNDSVALLCSNRVEFVEVVMASFRSGVRVTPINWHLTGEEIAYIVDNCDARILFADGQFAFKASEVAGMFDGATRYLSIGEEIKNQPV